jgi:hypothetical protein
MYGLSMACFVHYLVVCYFMISREGGDEDREGIWVVHFWVSGDGILELIHVES